MVKNIINDDIVVKFKSDSQGTGKGFEAVYTFIPLDACRYILLVKIKPSLEAFLVCLFNNYS